MRTKNGRQKTSREKKKQEKVPTEPFKFVKQRSEAAKRMEQKTQKKRDSKKGDFLIFFLHWRQKGTPHDWQNIGLSHAVGAADLSFSK
jgi:hypothetical protein